jgi:hypothetical protein
MELSWPNLGAQSWHFAGGTKKNYANRKLSGLRAEILTHNSRIQTAIDNYYTAFNIHGSVHCNNILIHIQQDATLHSLFYLETALHVSGGTITKRQERKQLYLQHLVFVTLKPVPSLPR